ncbi:MAG: hypothetical protein ACRED2_09035, partial [Methylocella sp.]
RQSRNAWQALLIWSNDAELSIAPAACLESAHAREAFERLGIADPVREDHFFHSVGEAIRVLAKKSNEFPED